MNQLDDCSRPGEGPRVPSHSTTHSVVIPCSSGALTVLITHPKQPYRLLFISSMTSGHFYLNIATRAACLPAAEMTGAADSLFLFDLLDLAAMLGSSLPLPAIKNVNTQPSEAPLTLAWKDDVGVWLVPCNFHPRRPVSRAPRCADQMDNTAKYCATIFLGRMM